MKNYLSIGDAVLMKDGKTLTVKSLDFFTFTANEEIGYQNKRDILFSGVGLEMYELATNKINKT